MLLSEAARGEGGRLFALRNGKPWYFMEEKYPELGNLMPRDITAREVWTVSRDYEVFLDMTELPKEVMEHKLAGLVDDCQTYLHKDIRKEPIPICRVSTTLWEAFRWTSGTALRCGICTLPVNAALSTMAQTVWVEILFWVRSMEDRLLRKLPAGKQSVPPICPVPKNPFCPNFPRTLKCR